MKILIIHASAGAGHTKAAEAVAQGFRNAGGHDVSIVDLLDFTRPWHKQSYRRTYAFLVSKVPWAWGFFFELVDIPCLDGLVRMVRRIFNHLSARRLERFLREQKFDYIFSTHFFANEVAAYLKRRGLIHSIIVGIITDFDVHRIWIASGIDYYAVACDDTKLKAMALGVAAERIFVTGIPTHEKFSRPMAVPALRQKLGLADRFTVLIATGSFGIGPIEAIIDRLKGYQIAAICGHNQKLFTALSAYRQEGLKVFGLVNNMDEMMAAADVMITKPGGLSISEALVRALPMVFFNAIPGQETNNVKVLAKYGIGVYRPEVDKIAAEIQALSASPETLSVARHKTEFLARPNAVKDIMKIADRV